MMVYNPYMIASPNRPGYATPQTDAPPWANYGFDRVTPGPGGGLSYEFGQRPFGGRPYWANSTYLEGGMGGLRPGMSIPNYADFYRRQQRYDAMNPPPTNTPTNVIGADDYARMGYSGSAEYLAATQPERWNPDGTPRGVTGTYGYGPNGPIPINQQFPNYQQPSPQFTMPMLRPFQGNYYGGGMMSSGGYGGGYQGGGTRGGMMGSYSGGGSQGRGGGGYGGLMGGFMGGRY